MTSINDNLALIVQRLARIEQRLETIELRLGGVLAQLNPSPMTRAELRHELAQKIDHAIHVNPDPQLTVRLYWVFDGPQPMWSRFFYKGDLKQGHVIKIVSEHETPEILWCAALSEEAEFAAMAREQAGTSRLTLKAGEWIDGVIIGHATRDAIASISTVKGDWLNEI